MADGIQPRALAAPNILGNTLHEWTQTDLFQRLDETGKVRAVAEVLNQRNEILQDMVFVQGNRTDGHEYAVRTKLPGAYWARLDRGVPADKSEIAVRKESCGILESRSIIDARKLKKAGAQSAYRFDTDLTFAEGLNQTMAKQLFYCDNIQEGFLGFTPRYNTLDKKMQVSKNVIDCGGKTDKKVASIWVISWSPTTVYGFYPEGQKVGLEMEDKGLQRVLDELGNPFYAYETMFSWAMGLAIEDWRYCVRLCNIDVDEIRSGRGLGTGDLSQPDSENLIMKLTDALSLLPTTGTGRTCIYMNPTLHSAFNRVALRSDQGVLSFSNRLNQYGLNIQEMTFNGFPVRRVDQLSLEEELVK